LLKPQIRKFPNIKNKIIPRLCQDKEDKFLQMKNLIHVAVEEDICHTQLYILI